MNCRELALTTLYTTLCLTGLAALIILGTYMEDDRGLLNAIRSDGKNEWHILTLGLAAVYIPVWITTHLVRRTYQDERRVVQQARAAGKTPPPFLPDNETVRAVDRWLAYVWLFVCFAIVLTGCTITIGASVIMPSWKLWVVAATIGTAITGIGAALAWHTIQFLMEKWTHPPTEI